MLDLFHHYKAWCTEPQILKSMIQSEQSLRSEKPWQETILFASGRETVTDRIKKYIQSLITTSSSPSSHPFYISMQDIDQRVSCCDVMSVSLKCQPTILHEYKPQNTIIWFFKTFQTDVSSNYREWHKKNGNFWKTQQKLKKSKKKKLLTEIEPLKLAF